MTGQKPTLSEAYQHCQQIARDHYENFPTASRLIRADLRPAVAAIYAFARAADDFADEGDAPADKRLKQLDAWEALLERCPQEELEHPVFLALGDAIKQYDLPEDELHALLAAFRMDVRFQAYATLDELKFYCRHSANPVGRLVLALHHIRHPQAMAASDAICTALQLTNFWQDLSRDLPNGRCYLPQEWLSAAAVDRQALLADQVDAVQLRPALLEAIAITRKLFDEGEALFAWLPFRLRLQIAATLHGGRAILNAVERSSDPVHMRPALSRLDWLRLSIKVLITSLRPRRRDIQEQAA